MCYSRTISLSGSDMGENALIEVGIGYYTYFALSTNNTLRKSFYRPFVDLRNAQANSLSTNPLKYCEES